MIKVIAYDLDGMVVEEPHYYSKELELKYGISPDDIDFSNSRKYLECKMGKITLREFFKPYYEKWKKKYPKFNLSMEEAIKEWFDLAQLNEKVVNIAKSLKAKGIKSFILTNNTNERVEYLDKKYKLSDTFEIIGSYDLGVLKPNSAFYKVLQGKYKLLPKEVLIFDDKEDNIKKLIRFSFNAKVFSNVSDFRKALIELNIF